MAGRRDSRKREVPFTPLTLNAFIGFALMEHEYGCGCPAKVIGVFVRGSRAVMLFESCEYGVGGRVLVDSGNVSLGIKVVEPEGTAEFLKQGTGDQVYYLDGRAIEKNWGLWNGTALKVLLTFGKGEHMSELEQKLLRSMGREFSQLMMDILKRTGGRKFRNISHITMRDGKLIVKVGNREIVIGRDE